MKKLLKLTYLTLLGLLILACSKETNADNIEQENFITNTASLNEKGIVKAILNGREYSINPNDIIVKEATTRSSTVVFPIINKRNKIDVEMTIPSDGRGAINVSTRIGENQFSTNLLFDGDELIGLDGEFLDCITNHEGTGITFIGNFIALAALTPACPPCGVIGGGVAAVSGAIVLADCANQSLGG